MNRQKEQERAELHKTIWKIADDLRGSVDGWDFKSYVLGFLFYRFICENLCDHIRKNDSSIDYPSLDEQRALRGKERILESKGFFILPSDLFESIRTKANLGGEHLENLNQSLATAFKNIESFCIGTPSEEQFKGLFAELDVNSQKLGNSNIERNKKLLQIMNAIAKLELGFKDNAIDTFGDAYEFLMGMYASSAGKSGGEYFTPQEVSELLVRLTLHNHTSPNKVYDPCCGSGSALLQYKKILKEEPALGYYGQEINLTSFNLCRMNMLLHNVSFNKIHIAHGDTLLSPNPAHTQTEPFDAIISNPPYSTKWIGKDDPTLINDPRFSSAGVLAPKGYADFAFILHMLSWLSEKGSCAVVCFPGIFYRGGAEKQIREYLITHNYIDAVIALPENLFFGTGIATYILILRKNKTAPNVLFINASKECIKVGKDNKLSPSNIAKILETYTQRKEIDYFSALASIEEIKENDFNLSVSRYVAQEDTREQIDIKTLNAELKQIVERQSKLRIELDSLIAEIEGAK